MQQAASPALTVILRIEHATPKFRNYGRHFERTLERARAASSMTVGPRVAPSEVGKTPRRGRPILGGVLMLFDATGPGF